MNNPAELAHNAIVFGFALIGAVGLPGVLLLFTQMMIGQHSGQSPRYRR